MSIVSSYEASQTYASRQYYGPTIGSTAQNPTIYNPEQYTSYYALPAYSRDPRETTPASAYSDRPGYHHPHGQSQSFGPESSRFPATASNYYTASYVYYTYQE